MTLPVTLLFFCGTYGRPRWWDGAHGGGEGVPKGPGYQQHPDLAQKMSTNFRSVNADPTNLAATPGSGREQWDKNIRQKYKCKKKTSVS